MRYKYTHTHTHTHTYIYIYFFVCVYNFVRGPWTSPDNLTYIVLSFSAGSDQVHESEMGPQWKKNVKKNFTKPCLKVEGVSVVLTKWQCVKSWHSLRRCLAKFPLLKLKLTVKFQAWRSPWLRVYLYLSLVLSNSLPSNSRRFTFICIFWTSLYPQVPYSISVFLLSSKLLSISVSPFFPADWLYLYSGRSLHFFLLPRFKVPNGWT